jgi:cyclophilin family peptidyl-prolyl cis-trans isomerase
MAEKRKIRMLGLVLAMICISVAGCRKDKPEEDPQGTPDALTTENRLIGGNDNGSPVTPFDNPGNNGGITPMTIQPAEPEIARIQVLLETSEGDILLELDAKEAPVTVTNFVRYVTEGYYDGTIFHRVIAGKVIQGGGHLPDMTAKPVHSPILNEASNGLKNTKGTIAMFRSDLPHTATSQFFINQGDNPILNYGSLQSPDGYAVFGRVIKGMDVVDALASVPTIVRNGEKSFPRQPVVLKKARIIPVG